MNTASTNISRSPVRQWLPFLFTALFALATLLLVEYFSVSASGSSDGKPSSLLLRTAKADTCKTPNERFFAPVIKELLTQGADSGFVKMIVNDPRTAFNETLVRINVIGQKKKADYSHNYTDYSVRSVQEFVEEHDSLLAAQEKKYGVPKEVVAALLWVETKHGTITGLHHVPSVYLSVAMCAQPEFIEKNKKAMHEKFDGEEAEAKELEEKIEQRAEKKAKWAIKELLALRQMQGILPLPIMNLYGSWAGAFGWSQFLPSSYLRAAVDGNGDGKVDLFQIADAVFSVGNYLNTAGWGSDKNQQRRALYNYNNSDDYVSAILALARKAGSDEISAAALKHVKYSKHSKRSKHTKSTAKKSVRSSKSKKASAKR